MTEVKAKTEKMIYGAGRIGELALALERGREQFEEIMRRIGEPDAVETAFAVDEIYDLPEGASVWKLPADAEGVQMSLPRTMEEAGASQRPVTGRIAAGENLDYMIWLLREQNMAGRIQLIYVDPPFFTGTKYQASVQIRGRNGEKSPVLKVGAYEDKWGHDLGKYLEMLAVRFLLMRELLADTGSLWVHLDWHGSHYVKMMLDEIFGHTNFINEVVWTYKSGGASKRSFARKHDSLLFYGKTPEYKFRPLREKSYNREGKPYHFKGVEEFEDENGWYTMVNMKDVWSIDMVGRTSAERMGYATQKPEKLLERIVDACTEEGDLCADFFAGTGTLGAVCARRGRPWILCDEGDAAIGSQILRMAEHGQRFQVERPERGDEIRPTASVQVAQKEGDLMLRSYRPDLTQVRQQDREIVTRFIAESSLDLISFWSIDPFYDGKTHNGRRLLAGDETVRLTRGEGGPISIVGYDIFGGRFQWTGRSKKE